MAAPRRCARRSGRRRADRPQRGHRRDLAGSARARTGLACRSRDMDRKGYDHMARQRPLRFGIFLAPFHRVGDNPTLALGRDMELIEWLDTLGYDEAWIGEHHSAGWELIASPEIFMGAAFERTKHIKLG